jgi:GntR family transcriptional regulator
VVGVSLSDKRPLYQQVADSLSHRVASGEWREGQQLPPEWQLAKEYGVGLATVRRAIFELVLQNVLVRRQGKGTFVATTRYNVPAQEVWGLTELMARLGAPARSELLRFGRVVPPDEVLRHLGDAAGDGVWELQYIRWADEMPFLVETTYLSIHYCPHLSERDLHQRSLHRILGDDYHLFLTTAIEFAEPILVDRDLAHMLGVYMGDPALRLYRRGMAASGECVEVTGSVIRGDRCRLYWRLMSGHAGPRLASL